MKCIKVSYFAMFRELAGKDEEQMELEVATLSDLYAHLAHKYQFNLPQEMIQVAVNDEFTSMNSIVASNSKVVFIPPVAGG